MITRSPLAAIADGDFSLIKLAETAMTREASVNVHSVTVAIIHAYQVIVIIAKRLLKLCSFCKIAHTPQQQNPDQYASHSLTSHQDVKTPFYENKWHWSIAIYFVIP